MTILHGLSQICYLLLFYVFKSRKKLALTNIQNSFPDMAQNQQLELAKSNYKNTCMVLAETIKGLSLSKNEIKHRVTFKNIELIEHYLQQDQSVIILSAHFCNIDWALSSCAQQLNFPMDAAYRTQRSAWLEEVFYTLRTRFDVTPLPMETFVADSLKRAKVTRMIGMASDQSPKKDDAKYWHFFLNQDTAFHTGTEKFARAFKYPIIFMSLRRIRNGYYEANLELLAEPPFEHEPNYIMKRYVDELEKMIKHNPADWLWAYRRWKLKKAA